MRHRWEKVDHRPAYQKAQCIKCGLIKSRAPNGFRTDWAANRLRDLTPKEGT